MNFAKTWLAVGTIVGIQIASTQTRATLDEALDQAMEAIKAVENACSRFDEDSELVHLLHAPIGTRVSVSPILFQSLQFALEIAHWTDGRFDPAVGARMVDLGFERHYLTGESLDWQTAPRQNASFRDIELDEQSQTVCLHRPMLLDLGAVAKGLAVDLAVKQLSAYDFMGFVVDAGGDLYAAGVNEEGEPWSVGIRHPLHREQTIRTLRATDVAICTSGTYERKSPHDENAHHILNSQSKQSAKGFVSITGIGPFTMMTDAVTTAAFLYPAAQSMALMEEAGLAGMLITEDLDIRLTAGMEGYLNESV